MATSRISNTTSLSSSLHERRQVQARIHALQQRTNALYEELSRSSSVTKSAVDDIERAYLTIINEFQDQRNQLLQRVNHVKQNIKQSTKELKSVRNDLNTAQSFRIPQISPRYSTDNDVYEVNTMVNDIERVLDKIAQQLKPVRFIPANGRTAGKTLGTIRIKDNNRKGKQLVLSDTSMDEANSVINLSIRKLYTIDLDICGHWVAASLDRRIFVCDNEGEIRIYSHSYQLGRQPLLTGRFHLATLRLISCFTVTQDYLITYESDTQILLLHSHHGILLLRLHCSYDPTIIVRCGYKKKNQIWTCSRTKRQCYQFYLNHTLKEVILLDKIDLTKPISNIPVDPVNISTDEQDRIAVYDVNPITLNRLILFSNEHSTTHSLDFIKYDSKPFSSRIERVLLVPKQSHLIVILYTSQSSSTTVLYEIVIANIHLEPPQILHRFFETNKIENIDITLNNELVYTVATPPNKQIRSKMHIYSLTN